MTMNVQPSILPGAPRVARYLSFSNRPGTGSAASMELVQSLDIDDRIVVGIGEPLVAHWGGNVPELRTFPALSGPGVQVPSEQQALWLWLHGDDQGELVNRSISIADSLADGFRLEQVVDAFKYGSDELGLDLTGYEDGTENPTGDDAVAAAIAADGSSFVAVQQWVHDLRSFSALPQTEQDHIIGRRKSDNEEIEDAPESAHVKRAEQESFTPEAIVLRRSMPFAQTYGEGLMFVAFGKTLDAFEVQLRRMAGLEDGITDALFRFSRPINGAYYWCPPVRNNRLDLVLLNTRWLIS
ncbi:MAG: Dyp-type peroxidase [Gammaproteobacteria bacterium]|nr:Dyp-type peroxidase [Gammaproteobacteria bacterium]